MPIDTPKKVIFVRILGGGDEPWITSLYKRQYEAEEDFRKDYKEHVQRDGRLWMIPFCGAVELSNVNFQEIPDKVVFIDLAPEQGWWLTIKRAGGQSGLGKVHAMVKIGFDDYFMGAKPLQVELETER